MTTRGQKSVVDQLTETLQLLDEAAATLPPYSEATKDVYAKHASIRTQVEALRDSYGKPAEDASLKVFPKRIGGSSGIQDMCNWINEHDLADRIVSVIHTTGLGYLILYKAFEEIPK